MESQTITADQITSSSVYTTTGLFGLTTGRWRSSFARLNQRGHNNAWMPAKHDENPWIQVWK